MRTCEETGIGVSPILESVRRTIRPPAPATVPGWTNAPEAGHRRPGRQILRRDVGLIEFCIPAIVAIIARPRRRHLSILTMVAVTTEITLVLIPAAQTAINADLSQDRSWSVADVDVTTTSREAGRHSDGVAG
ncbi:hypothetical protein [Actinoplanes palleronii]|uniref:Transposase n=1 Tax=Actinoplanes palleronii TaxID=113570 RepID=A0ABQ4BDF2_9ACTN|nr:hypothetical protein [Actinoplanes palleronii]GIE68610.1 hypothetical protein Apa02nite_047180 [Actinoplanes palleronii]